MIDLKRTARALPVLPTLLLLFPLLSAPLSAQGGPRPGMGEGRGARGEMEARGALELPRMIAAALENQDVLGLTPKQIEDLRVLRGDIEEAMAPMRERMRGEMRGRMGSGRGEPERRSREMEERARQMRSEARARMEEMQETMVPFRERFDAIVSGEQSNRIRSLIRPDPR